MRYLSIVFFSLFLTFSSCTTQHSQENTTYISNFSTYIDTLFASEASSNTLSLHYSIVNPTSYGITEPEITLGRFSKEALQESISLTEQELDILHSFSYDSLTKEEQFTYDILESALSLSLMSKGMELYHEQLSPTTGIQAQLPLLLAEYRLETKEDITTYLSLLPCIYTYFSDLALYEKERSEAGLFMSDTIADSIITQCKAFIETPEENFLITYFNEKISSLSILSPTECMEYQIENTKQVFRYVIPAYELLIHTLTELKGTGRGEYGLCYYPLGRNYYEYLVYQNTGTSKSIDELKNLLGTTLSENLNFLKNTILETPSVYTQYVTFQYPMTEPIETLSYLQTAIQETFPTPANTSCEIRYVHHSLEDYVSPAMYFVPPIDGYEKNCIYINQSPMYNISMLFPTLAHEGYPGHLYQHTYFLDTNPEPIRCLLNFSGYDEGWATYAESLSYYLADLEKPLADFLKANLISTLCLYSLTDIYIHYDGFSKEDTIAFLNDYGISEEIADSMFYTLLAEPTMYHPYTIGYLELLELKELYKSFTKETYKDLDFHTFILNAGPAPFEILEKYLRISFIK